MESPGGKAPAQFIGSGNGVNLILSCMKCEGLKNHRLTRIEVPRRTPGRRLFAWACWSQLPFIYRRGGGFPLPGPLCRW